PQGFYVRLARAPQTGDFVTIASVDVAPDYAALRGFADPTDQFIKRIAAGRGQTVCAEGDRISIDGRVAAVRGGHDAAGRALPTWSGCRTLGADEILLLGDTPDSFDGRYWGPISRRLIEGVWRPIAR
ncbi:MAG: S26 family signal peptidase, partial [Hyphomonadaceae bacterium]|nr:S26 family signal peptidase [Hyphomonadaceae bacterium]